MGITRAPYTYHTICRHAPIYLSTTNVCIDVSMYIIYAPMYVCMYANTDNKQGGPFVAANVYQAYLSKYDQGLEDTVLNNEEPDLPCTICGNIASCYILFSFLALYLPYQVVHGK